MIKRPYNPGQKRKRRFSQPSEYGRQLIEKQKLKNWYCLGEREFKNCIKDILNKKVRLEDPSELLIRSLETRLDNIVYRLGFASSRAQARQLVSHGFILVNNKLIDVPSYRVTKKDIIVVSPAKAKKVIIQNLKPLLKKYKTPGWLELDAEKLEGKIIGVPTVQEVMPPAEISSIFEFYSR